jgi:hypothetical protein
MNGLQFFLHNDPDAVRVEFAGSLRGADVEAARQAWQRAILLSARAEDPLRAVNSDALKPVIVDITFITHADEHGRALLIVMHQSGARIVAQSPESSAIAQPIVIQPIEAHEPRPGWFHRLTMFLLEERPASAALPAQAGIPNAVSAGSQHASIEYTGPGGLGVLEDAVRYTKAEVAGCAGRY